MAIKGKSKSRKGKRAGSAPKPVVVERTTPFLQRTIVRRSIVGVLVFLAILGGLRIWQNTGRANSLRKYDRSLVRAQALLTQHFAPDSLTSMQKTVEGFTNNQVTGKQFEDVAKLWEKDFAATKDTVQKLKPPKPLTAAQDLIVQGIDGYVGVARLFQVAGVQRQTADAATALAKATKDPAEKKKIEAQAKKDADQVQTLMLQANEWRGRADAVYNAGLVQINDLKAEWHTEAPSTSQTGDAVPAGLLPAIFLRFAG